MRFRHPVRITSLGVEPRIIRTLTANLSLRGTFIRMPEPFATGTKLALALEVGGCALPFAEGEVVWSRPRESQMPGRYAGAGVRFSRFLHPRAPELVHYLVATLDTGRPLRAAPRPHWARRLVGIAASGAAIALMFLGFWPQPPPDPEPAVFAALTAPNPPEGPTEAIDPSWLEPAVDEGLPPDAEGEFSLPSGAARAVSWALASSELRVGIDGGQLRRHFLLEAPPRVVFDVDGPPPKTSVTLARVSAPLRPFIQKVRVGRQGTTTRVVVDLARAPRDVSDDGEAVILSF